MIKRKPIRNSDASESGLLAVCLGALIQLAPISREDALAYMEKHSQYRGGFDLAICAKDGDTVHGVIVLKADGETFALGHISTDGNAHIGSLLYGGAWRVAKALGYKSVHI